MSGKITNEKAIQPLAYQVSPFCRSLGIGRTKFYELMKQGKIRTVVIGGRRLIPASEAQRLVEQSAA
jgi:excisionase family DNA binding protein